MTNLQNEIIKNVYYIIMKNTIMVPRLMTMTTKDTTTKMKDTVPPKNAKGIITVAKLPKANIAVKLFFPKLRQKLPA